jgi:hypothetical protein
MSNTVIVASKESSGLFSYDRMLSVGTGERAHGLE